MNFRTTPFIFLIAALSFLHFNLTAQVVSGKIIDAKTLEALPYVNVLVPGTDLGTLTNTDGWFQIDISKANFDHDSIRFSQLSYTTITLNLSSFKDSSVIKLGSSAVTLNEVVVSPQPPEEYIKQAVKNIPKNYVDTSYNTVVYFRETVKLNGKYMNNTEAIMNAYNLSITGNEKPDSTRLQLIAMRYINESQEAVKTVKIKRNQKKQQEIDSTILASVEAMSRDNGPYMVIDSGLERRWYAYDTDKVLGDYHFRFKNITPHQNRKLLNITYSDKKNEDKGKEHGYVYLEENSLAIESYGYQYHGFPTAIKAALFLFGYDINDFIIKVKSTTKPTEQGYIPDIAILRAEIDLEKMKLFSSNVPIKMEIEAVMIVLDHQIPATNPCTEGIILKRGKPLYEQAEPNPSHPIWKQYEGLILPEGSGF